MANLRSKGIDVQFPDLRTANQWEITAEGQVGYIPLSPEVALSLQSKVPLTNLFAMLEYAYDLKSFRFLEGWNQCESLNDFYERLQKYLAVVFLTVLAKDSTLPISTRRNVYHAYEVVSASLVRFIVLGMSNFSATTKNKLLTSKTIKSFYGHYDKLSITVLFAKSVDQRTPSISSPTSHHQIESFSAQDCTGRTYHRLNDDYQTLHALC